MPTNACILVSIGNGAYSNVDCLSYILLEAAKPNDNVFLIIGDSLRRWNLLSTLNDADDALSKSIHDGDTWCNSFLSMVQLYVGTKLRKIIRWEELRGGKEFEYKQNRELFDKFCVKRNVLEILQKIFVELKIDSIDDLLKNEKQLLQKKGGLIATQSSSWENISWESAMAATLLEYAIRHFKQVHSKSCQQDQKERKADGANTNTSKEAFIKFLFETFFSNAFEHQAEEATILYFCLPNEKKGDYRFDNLYYPNVIAPIFKKAQLLVNGKANGKGCLRWNAVKINQNLEVSLQEWVENFFKQNKAFSRGEKLIYSRLALPCVTAIVNSNGQKRGELVLSLINLLMEAYMWTSQSNAASPYHSFQFFGPGQSPSATLSPEREEEQNQDGNDSQSTSSQCLPPIFDESGKIAQGGSLLSLVHMAPASSGSSSSITDSVNTSTKNTATVIVPQ